jgi:pimeloyl-ACP methyl ester carboxylesterase
VPEALTVPVLIAHGPQDALAGWEHSRAFADARPDLVTLHAVPRAPHAAMWNADREGYEEALSRFLMPLL